LHLNSDTDSSTEEVKIPSPKEVVLESKKAGLKTFNDDSDCDDMVPSNRNKDFIS
jgi:hypothetical protein